MERGVDMTRGQIMYVYFLQAGKDGPIKIGATSELERRLKQMQTGNHLELNYIACIPCDNKGEALKLEADFHRFFLRQRIRGEWFKGEIDFNKIKTFHRNDIEIIE
jgi:predicted GIY-YIG superfamily endonuclease